jgi:hypothetical protein
MKKIVKGQKHRLYDKLFSGCDTIVILGRAIRNPIAVRFYISGSDRRAVYGITRNKLEKDFNAVILEEDE